MIVDRLRAARGAIRRLALALLVGAALAPAARAQSAAAASAPAPPLAPVRSAPEILVVTFGQGDYVWERFGHNAIWVRDTTTGESVMYHWGLFDFDQPNFVGRFLTGDTKYWMEGFDAESMLDAYRSYDRSIVVQRLAFTPAQAAAMRDFLRWNEHPDNRYYRYDYYRDNCSTRLRDAIDRAMGGALRGALDTVVTPHTHRSESLRLVDGMPLTQAGMHVALGHPADVPMTAWEEAFVPMRLRDRLRGVRVAGPAGVPVPLVAEERTLYTARRGAEAARPPRLAPRYLVVGAALAALLAVTGAAAARRRGARIAFGTLAMLWSFVAGVVGTLVVLAWAFTRHDFWDRNENLFQLGPQSLVLFLLVPLALARPRWRGAAATVGLVVAGLSLLGLALHALPGFDQPNRAIIALALPAHAAVAWGLRRLRATA